MPLFGMVARFYPGASPLRHRTIRRYGGGIKFAVYDSSIEDAREKN